MSKLLKLNAGNGKSIEKNIIQGLIYIQNQHDRDRIKKTLQAHLP